MEPMDNAQKAEQIDARFDALEDMQISDDQSARDAYTHAMLTVNRINQLSAQANAQAIMGAGTSVDDLLEKVRKWLDRLVVAMAQIVEKLAGATSFSISVGSNVSVAVDFEPFERGSA
jgi:hypothetical protein